MTLTVFFFFFSSRRRHTRLQGDWSSDVCSSDLVRQVEQIIGRTPDVNGYFTIVGGFAGGVNSAFIGVILKDWGARHTSVQQMIGGLFPQLMGPSGLLAFPYAAGAIGFSHPHPYVLQN